MTSAQTSAARPPGPGADDAPVLPPVVVVVVARDPGDWFEETLRSIDAQTYANLSVLVVDAGSAVPVAARVAAVLPDAHEQRFEDNPGFGPACNRALEAVRGAAFYLLCHDDIRLEPDSVKLMVEEAFRANAGVVGAKLVRWDAPDELLSVGMGVDRWGQPSPLIERGELDQAQHDAVRDVFWVPGAATLVRADLFAALGGFDPSIDLLGEDLDLCWRAQVAGASVVVAVGARVAHLEALALRRAHDDRRRLQLRHRQRTLRVCSTRATRWRLLPPAMVLSLLEVLASIVLLRFAQARDVLGAWTWNLRRGGEIRSRRRALDNVRAVSDAELRVSMVSGSARMREFLRGRIGRGDDRLLDRTGSKTMANRLRRVSNQLALAAWVAVVVVMTYGTRELLGGPIPAVGDFARFGSDPATLIGGWLGGYSVSGVGAGAPGPPALGLFGALSTVLLGATSLARSLLILVALPIGVLGAWRLAAPIGSRRAQVASMVVFAANPLTYNALSEGHWAALVTVAMSPWILLHLARASMVAPFGPAGEDGVTARGPRSFTRSVVSLGMVTAVTALWFPAAPVLVAAVAILFVLGGVVVGRGVGWWRLIVGAGLGGLVAVALTAPWSISLLVELDPSALLASGAGSVPEITTGELVRFETGPVGSSVLSWALPISASLGLLIGRSWRLGWSARCWFVVLAAWGGVELQARGLYPESFPMPSAEILLAPAVAALALAAAMGAASFEVDLRDYSFGWRQLASVIAAGAMAVAFIPLVGSSADGRWAMPTRALADKVLFTEEEASEEPFRLLWLGDPGLVPMAGWDLDTSAADLPVGRSVIATSWGGPPQAADLWLGPRQVGNDELVAAVELALSGGSQRLGELVAPMGVRYVVLPELAVPVSDETDGLPDRDTASPGLVEVLERQLDLAVVPLGGSVRVFENTEWVPAMTLFPPGAQLDDDEEITTGSGVGVLGGGRPLRSSGPLDTPGVLYVASQRDDGWVLEIDGAELTPRDVGSWAMAFDVDAPSSGAATLEHRNGIAGSALLLAPLALWVLAGAYVSRRRPTQEVTS